MKTCKDCIHYDVCAYHITEETDMSVQECACGFKDKARYIEVPCKVGDNGYLLSIYGILPVTFDKIFLSVNNKWLVRARYFVKEIVYLLFEDFGKVVFLTREEAEEAEKALKKRSNR